MIYIKKHKNKKNRKNRKIWNKKNKLIFDANQKQKTKSKFTNIEKKIKMMTNLSINQKMTTTVNVMIIKHRPKYRIDIGYVLYLFVLYILMH